MKERFKIAEFTTPGGVTKWRVSGYHPDGKQVRQKFLTQGEAVAFQQAETCKALNMPAPALVTTRLTAEQTAECEALYRRITGKPYTLTEALEFAVANYKPTTKRATVQTVYDEYIKSLTTARKRPVSNLHLKAVKSRLAFLIRPLGAREIASIGSAELTPIIKRESLGLVASDNSYRAFASFFAFAVAQDYLARSPMGQITREQLPESEAQILELNACREIMAHAQAMFDEALVPYFALALFCAVRPTEITRVKWSDIDLDDEHPTLTLDRSATKTNSTRVVEIPRCAVAWLKPHADAKTPIICANFRKRFDAVKLAAGFGTRTDENPGLKPWVMDVMRHTAISMRLADVHDVGKVASWAGNSPAVIHKHYKVPVKPKVALAFYETVPALPRLAFVNTCTPAKTGTHD